jgi:hypothetical protein
MTEGSEAQRRVRIPADVDRPDRILVGLTARQLTILAATGLLLYLGYTATRSLLPPLVFAVFAMPVAATGAALALGRYDGVGLDRLAAAALAHARTAHRQVPTGGGEGVPAGPGWSGWPAPAPPAPLRMPADGLDPDGVVELGADGTAVVCRCAPVNFALRSPAEQAALIGAFGRFCNAATGPIQILVRAVPVDLSGQVTALRDAAGGLPHPALETAAREHAAFLAELAGRRDLLRRELLLVLRQPAAVGPRRGRGEPAGRLARRAQEAATALAAAGVTVTVLGGPQATDVLAAAADPTTARPARLAAPNAVITGPSITGEEEPSWSTD